MTNSAYAKNNGDGLHPGNEVAEVKDPGLRGWERGNLVPRACDPWEGNEGSGVIRCRKPGIVAKIELRIRFNGQSESSLKRIIPEPSFPSRVSQARGTRLGTRLTSISFPEYACSRVR
jgi:hypothetical protein